MHEHYSHCHGEQVIACSDSNIAVDNLMEGLLGVGVRVVSTSKVDLLTEHSTLIGDCANVSACCVDLYKPATGHNDLSAN
jgi:hypothetical protein